MVKLYRKGISNSPKDECVAALRNLDWTARHQYFELLGTGTMNDYLRLGFHPYQVLKDFSPDELLWGRSTAVTWKKTTAIPMDDKDRKVQVKLTDLWPNALKHK